MQRGSNVDRASSANDAQDSSVSRVCTACQGSHLIDQFVMRNGRNSLSAICNACRDGANERRKSQQKIERGKSSSARSTPVRGMGTSRAETYTDRSDRDPEEDDIPAQEGLNSTRASSLDAEDQEDEDSLGQELSPGTRASVVGFNGEAQAIASGRVAGPRQSQSRSSRSRSLVSDSPSNSSGRRAVTHRDDDDDDDEHRQHLATSVPSKSKEVGTINHPLLHWMFLFFVMTGICFYWLATQTKRLDLLQF